MRGLERAQTSGKSGAGRPGAVARADAMPAARLLARTRAFALLLAVLPALAGCGTVDLDQVSVPMSTAEPAPRSASQAPPMTAEQRREHERLVASYGGAYADPQLKALIQQVVERLVAASERPDLKYRVTVLNSPAINAFALPDGSLYVTRGLLALANDTSELASVLSHEMAHVIARHANIREDQVKQAVLVSDVISHVVNDPSLGALALQKSKRTLASFSRGQELEADAIGVGISARAGFDPYGASRFLADMGHQSELRATALGGGSGSQNEEMDFLASHPATPERISIAVANARQYAPTPGNGERDKAAYLGAIEGMVYGDDPKEGFVRGRKFSHPKLGFTFTAPEGFTLENTSQAILGATQSGREALRLDAVRVAADQSLGQYLASGWIDGVEINSVESLMVGGFPAATAIARGEQWSFRMFAIRFGTDVYRMIFAARDLTPEIDKQFRMSADSFRRVSSEEAAGIKPLRLQVVTVGLTDTVEKLSARMMVPDRHVERFLILNGLEQGAKLKYGDKVKIVAE